MPIPDRVRDRLDYWKQRLVDLSKRNRLLHFRRTKSSTLYIVEPEPVEVADLLISGKPWSIFVPDNPDQESLSLDRLHGQNGQVPDRSRGEREILTDAEDQTKLDRTLRNLFRRSYTDYQERGVRILHIAIGMLTWKEQGSSDLIQSPILLIPVELRREDARSQWELYPTEEEVVVNPALDLKLRSDFNISLPPAPENWENGNVEAYLERVFGELQQMDWHVEKSAILSLFSFHKLVIYTDLETNAETLAENRIIKALSGEERYRDENGDIPDESEMDRLHNPKKAYQILDADSSQQVCIQAMLEGHSIIVQGPPGTGKSQTIANMISECIGRGKSVLFVSEKMAALEVVYRRLREKKLEDFCLELHSHKSSKREVARELGRCLLRQRSSTRHMPAGELDTLLQRRQELNEYVEELHKPRDPSGWTVFQVFERLAQLGPSHVCSVGLNDVEHLTEDRLAHLRSLVDKLQRTWRVVEEGEAFPWRGYVADCQGIVARKKLEQQLRDLQSQLSDLTMQTKETARQIGVSLDDHNMEDVLWLVAAARLVDESPGAERSWLVDADLGSLRNEAQHHCDQAAEHKRLVDELTSFYGDSILDLDDSAPQLFREALASLQSLTRAGETDIRDTFKYRKEAESFLTDTVRLCNKWSADCSSLRSLFGIDEESTTIGRLRELAELAIVSGFPDRPDPSWLNVERLRRIREDLPSYSEDILKHNQLWRRLEPEYDEAFLALDLDHLIQRFSGWYSWPVRWLLPGFYKARRQVLNSSRKAELSPTIRDDLIVAREVVRLRRRIEPQLEPLIDILGWYYKGYETEWQRVDAALNCAEKILRLLGQPRASDEATRILSASQLEDSDLSERGKKIVSEIDKWTEMLNSLPVAIARGCGVREHASESLLLPIETIRDATAEVCGTINTLNTIISQMGNGADLTGIRGFDKILGDLDKLRHARDIEADIDKESQTLKKKYGDRFGGIDTDWDDILRALEWSSRVVRHFGTAGVPNEFLDLCNDSNRDETIGTMYESVVDQVESAFGRFQENFDDEGLRVGEQQWRKASLSDLSEFLETLRNRLDDLQLWTDFREAVAKCNDAGILAFVEDATSRRISADELSDAFLRSIYTEWIDAVRGRVEVLRKFRREDHDKLIAEFRALDKKSVDTASALVIASAEKRLPASTAGQLSGSEPSIILKEHKKKSRHLPIRRLLKLVSNILFQIKPCFLMSPLSVSQFLDPESHRFDVVIFDEASQICPEDAVGAIYRGKQLVVAGDSKQLPPTRFFEREVGDDYTPEEEDDESYASFESILDECETIPLPAPPLRWHYRSRHESLIAFSNCYFYRDSLITFPCPSKEAPDLGVRFEYVPDGIYDRGGARDNKVEAQRVVDLVFEHFREKPRKTLGVVAFSQAQMVAIEDALELRRQENPEFERFFGDDRLEGFFVKNLENVQGDERDVLIFSVGYGKDRLGRMSTNFGPINKDGGERRLNVEITRAREQVIVVSSIKASDIDLSTTQSDGVRMLHRYLEYAEKGPEILERGLGYSSGEPESPFEKDVIAEIRQMGFECHSQVGCSSYRIDIGVVDSDRPGCYLLGVECDGAMYHSAPTARDRDRLRQSVLENLGWRGRLHRIWSTEWMSRRDTEIRRLREAISRAKELAEQLGLLNTQEPQPAESADPTEQESEETQGFEQADNQVEMLELPGTEQYVSCRLPEVKWYAPQLADPLNRRPVRKLLAYLVEKEGPIHVDHAIDRIRQAHGSRRAGSRIRESVELVIEMCQDNGELIKNGNFLVPFGANQTRVRLPSDSDVFSRRPLDWISDDELALAMVVITKHCTAVDQEALVKHTCRLYGFERTGRKLHSRLQSILEKLLREGRLVLCGDSVCVASDPPHPQNSPVESPLNTHNHATRQDDSQQAQGTEQTSDSANVDVARELERPDFKPRRVRVNGRLGTAYYMESNPRGVKWTVRLDGERKPRQFQSPPATVRDV